MRANNIRSSFSRAIGAIGAMAVGALVASPAFAQDSGSEGLDEVVVQARKFSENLQDVPLSVSVISSEDIARQNLQSTEDISRLDPSVIFDYGGSMTDMRVVIRGLSPTRGRVNSAILVDGVDVTSESIQFGGGSSLAGARLFDLEQVEIVKGPQAALYGRAAFAGAISYRTKDPAKEFGAEIRTDGSEKGRYSLGAGVDIPVNDSFGLRLSGTYFNRDSIYQNIALNGDTGGGDGFGLAATAKWQSSENFSARLRLEYNDDSEDMRATAYLRHNVAADPPFLCANAAARTASTTCVFTGSPIGPTQALNPFGERPGSATRAFYWGSAGRLSDYAAGLRPNYSLDPTTGQMYPGADRQILRGNLNLEWQLASGTLTSITGFTNADTFFWQDLDYDSVLVGASTVDTARRISEYKADTKTKQFSQEFRFRSKFEGPVNFTIGGLFYTAKDDNVTQSISVLCNTQFVNCGGPIPAGPPGVFITIFPAVPAATIAGRLNPLDRFWGRDLDHKSFYGMVEFKPTDHWSFEIEGRHSKETEFIYGPNCDPANTFTWPAGPPFFGTVQPCQDPTMTPTGSPYAGTPVASFFAAPQSVDFPSLALLYSGLTAAGPRQQTAVTVRTPDYNSKFTTYRAYAKYEATDNINIYATVGRSIKPGGRSTVTAGAWIDGDYNGVYDDTLYGPEKLLAYELGFKAQWLNNRLRTNFAVFRQDYTDKQIGVQTITPGGIPVGRVINSGAAKIDGFEADLQWKATDHLTLAASYSYLDARYTKFAFRTNSSTDAIRFADCTRATQVTSTGATSYFCDVDALKNRKLKLEDVPEHSLVLQARYERPAAFFGGSSWYIEGDSQVQTERFVDPANRRFVEDYVIANLRVGLVDDNKKWDVMLYVNNVTDDDTILSATDNPGEPDAGLFNPTQFGPTDGLSVTLPDPRIVGVRFNWRFGGSK